MPENTVPIPSRWREKALAEIVDRADQRAANVIPIMRQIQRSGATSLRQIAEALNARGISAPVFPDLPSSYATNPELARGAAARAVAKELGRCAALLSQDVTDTN